MVNHHLVKSGIGNAVVNVGATDMQTFTIFIRTCPAKHEHGLLQNTEGVRKFLTLFTACTERWLFKLARFHQR